MSSFQGISGLARDLHKRKQILVLQNLDEKSHSLITSDNVQFCQTEETLKNTLLRHDIHNRCSAFITCDKSTKDKGRPTEALIGATELTED